MDQIYYYLPALETIRDFLELGGDVLYVIGFLTLFMWILIIERLVYLRAGHKRMAMKAQQLWDGRKPRLPAAAAQSPDGKGRRQPRGIWQRQDH